MEALLVKGAAVAEVRAEDEGRDAVVDCPPCRACQRSTAAFHSTQMAEDSRLRFAFSLAFFSRS